MPSDKYSDHLKKDVTNKNYINDSEKIKLENMKMLRELVGKKVVIESSGMRGKREYLVNDIGEAYTEGFQGLVPAFKLINKSLPEDKQIVLNLPKVLIDKDELFDGRKFMLLEYESKLNIVKSFKHLHKPNREPLLIYIYYYSI